MILLIISLSHKMAEIDYLMDSLFNLFTFTSISSYGEVKNENYRMYEHIIEYYNDNKKFKFNFIYKNNNLVFEYNKKIFTGYRNISENIKNILLEFEIKKIAKEIKNLERSFLYDTIVLKFLCSKFSIDIALKIIKKNDK